MLRTIQLLLSRLSQRHVNLNAVSSVLSSWCGRTLGPRFEEQRPLEARRKLRERPLDAAEIAAVHVVGDAVARALPGRAARACPSKLFAKNA